MYIITNAMQNLVRNKGRNLMIGAIILVMIVCVVTALMINNTASAVIDDYKARFNSEVILSPNQDKVREEAEANSSDGLFRMMLPQINPEDYVSYGQSDYLQKAEFSASTNVNTDQLTAANADLGPGGANRGFSRNGPGGPQEFTSTQFYFEVLNDFSDFTSGTRELDTTYDTATAQSRFPESQNECIVSADVMEASGLTLGDTVTVTGELTTPLDPDDVEAVDPTDPGSLVADLEITEISWTMTIVGVYTDLTQTEDQLSRLRSAWDDRRNEILTTFETLLANLQDGKQGISVSATYYLKDPEMLGAFDAELRTKGLSELWLVTTDSSSYNQVVRPVEALKSVSMTFVIIVLIFGAVILALLSSIAIRERKYEIGVLRAMGMKRAKVVGGLWTETLAITVICLILGLGIGVAVAQPITNVLYEQQLEAIKTEAQTDNPMGFPGDGRGGMQAGPGMGMSLPGQTQVEPLQNLDISLDVVTVLEILGIALLLSSVAGIVSTTQITKYEPIKILMERN